ncbi:MAG: squalene/phytoene synthase family protein [Elusimicrobiota bacterium]|jgi:phytoene synthase
MNMREAGDARVGDPKDIFAAYSFCRKVSSFECGRPPGIRRLVPRRLRPHVDAVCAFARLAAAFASAPEFEAERAQRLRTWRGWLQAVARDEAAASSGDLHPVFLALARTMRECDLPPVLFEDILDAHLQDVGRKGYATFDELKDYCRRCANPVGRLLLMILGYRDEESGRCSDALCTAWRLSASLRDISLDLKRDHIYIPGEDFQAQGYAEADLRMGVCNERFRELMKAQASRARALFEEARPLPAQLRWPLSWAARLTWYGGREILRQIRKSGFDTISRRPRLSRWDWLPLMLRTVLKP